MALSTVFHSINSPNNSLLSLSVLLVLFLSLWSFQLHIYTYLHGSLPHPWLIRCCWLGLKHQPANQLTNCCYYCSYYYACFGWQILGHPTQRQLLGHDAALVLTLLVQYRKYEVSNSSCFPSNEEAKSCGTLYKMVHCVFLFSFMITVNIEMILSSS